MYVVCLVFFLPVLEVCGCNRGLLSELRAVGKFFHSTLKNSQILAGRTGGLLEFYQVKTEKEKINE